MPTPKLPIKIAVSGGKDVSLNADGSIVCGRVTYKSRRYKDEFMRAYEEIDYHLREFKIKRRDVSGYEIRDVEDVYATMVQKWQRTISVERVRRLADESRIKGITNALSRPFMRYVNQTWYKKFRSMDEKEREHFKTSDKLY